MNIVIIGMSGVGKSTIGKLLAKELGYLFIDLDKSIELKCGVDITTIFAIEGEEGFRYREYEELVNVLKNNNSVIATGGGVVNKVENINLLKSDPNIIVIYLTSDLENIMKRVSYNIHKRPMLQKSNLKDTIEKMHTERDYLYKKVAHFIVDATNSNINKTVIIMLNVLKDYCKNNLISI